MYEELLNSIIKEAYFKVFNCIYLFVYMGVLLILMHLYHMHALCPWGPEEGVRFPGNGIQVVVNHYVGAGSENWVLCKSTSTQWVLLPAELAASE